MARKEPKGSQEPAGSSVHKALQAPAGQLGRGEQRAKKARSAQLVSTAVKGPRAAQGSGDWLEFRACHDRGKEWGEAAWDRCLEGHGSEMRRVRPHRPPGLVQPFPSPSGDCQFVSVVGGFCKPGLGVRSRTAHQYGDLSHGSQGAPGAEGPEGKLGTQVPIPTLYFNVGPLREGWGCGRTPLMTRAAPQRGTAMGLPLERVSQELGAAQAEGDRPVLLARKVTEATVGSLATWALQEDQELMETRAHWVQRVYRESLAWKDRKDLSACMATQDLLVTEGNQDPGEKREKLEPKACQDSQEKLVPRPCQATLAREVLPASREDQVIQVLEGFQGCLVFPACKDWMAFPGNLVWQEKQGFLEGVGLLACLGTQAGKV
ncbi:PREDICTED: uncharacterized protein LOC104568718 [Tinamus guttatus]|uniref:uncharacterized protein LOC104568718 n=1 Tax=Tinamus guttatus TaxID=94827 RepID=UPI00052EE342|nr:PREDICTED: uncharacterized protein LOC104568718 [Tinamus guttatus]